MATYTALQGNLCIWYFLNDHLYKFTICPNVCNYDNKAFISWYLCEWFPENGDVIYGIKGGMEGFVIIMYEGTCEQEVPIPGPKAM